MQPALLEADGTYLLVSEKVSSATTADPISLHLKFSIWCLGYLAFSGVKDTIVKCFLVSEEFFLLLQLLLS